MHRHPGDPDTYLKLNEPIPGCPLCEWMVKGIADAAAKGDESVEGIGRQVLTTHMVNAHPTNADEIPW